MKETATQVNERKIRNGIRKQREKIQREKDKVWDRLRNVDRPLRQLIASTHGLDLEQELADALTAELASFPPPNQNWVDKLRKDLEALVAAEKNKCKNQK